MLCGMRDLPSDSNLTRKGEPLDCTLQPGKKKIAARPQHCHLTKCGANEK